MHELTRLAYLRALGVDTYVSRRQLPGAATTHRLALRRRREPATPPPPAAAVASLAPRREAPAAPAPAAGVETPSSAVPARTPSAEVPRFSYAALVAGEWLWLENLGEWPLRSEQAALVRAMAYALVRARAAGQPRPPVPARGDASRFDWPMHNNRQLDNGAEAARAGLQAFVERRLRDHGCRGLVLLGGECEDWLDPGDFEVTVARTLSTARALAEPALKAQMWRDLEALRRG